MDGFHDLETAPMVAGLVEQAGRLLWRRQLTAWRLTLGLRGLTQDECTQLVARMVSGENPDGRAVLHEGRLVAYAVPIVEKEDLWGSSGWLPIGAWAAEPGWEGALQPLYRDIGGTWARHGNLRHCFQVFSSETRSLETARALGFAVQQIHGVLSLEHMHPWTDPGDGLQVRRAMADDLPDICRLSRVIALHQTESPCFATAPEEYLEKLDAGYAELLEDPEADVHVVIDHGGLIGLAIFYDQIASPLLAPAEATELSVCVIKEGARGRGAGSALISAALAAKLADGYRYCIADRRSANLQAAAFWPQQGFVPVVYRLYRRVFA
jgi:GNAT superfamily N-acetyltransferase